MKAILKLKNELDEIRDKYIKCMDELEAKYFIVESNRTKCLGKNFIKLMLDIRYLMM